MPVNATPIYLRTASELQTDDDLDILDPGVSTSYDNQLLTKKRGVKAREATKVYLRMTIRGKNGVGEDLTNYGISGSSGLESLDSSSSMSTAATVSSSESSSTLSYGNVKVRFREAALVDTTTYEIQAAVLNANEGIIMCRVPSAVINKRGIWFAEAGGLDDEGDLLFSDECYIYVESSSWTNNPSGMSPGPPQIDDIRLSLRDNSPYENELIENFDFDVAEICSAAIRVVHYWNERPPVIAIARYSALTFPFREIWTQGIRLNLFSLAEEHYRRNHLPYSAGGVSTDDKNRHRDYQAAMQNQWQTFEKLVTHTKVRINAQQAYGTVRAGYGNYGLSGRGY